jgi:hypothetical protein
VVTSIKEATPRHRFRPAAVVQQTTHRPQTIGEYWSMSSFIVVQMRPSPGKLFRAAGWQNATSDLPS